MRENEYDFPKLEESDWLKSELSVDVFSKISSKSMNFSMKDENIIEECLAEICKKTNSSRAYVFFFRNNLDYMDNVYEWCEKGVSAEKDNLQNLKTEICPWWMEKLKSNEIISIENVEKMPEEAEVEKEMLLEQGIKSLIVLPMMYEERLIGYVGIDNIFGYRNWNEESLLLLRMVSEMFSGFFSRNRFIDSRLGGNRRCVRCLQYSGDLDAETRVCLCRNIGMNKENVNRIVENVIEAMKTDMGIFDEIQLNLDYSIPNILCNKIELSQVISGIIKNAVYEIDKKIEILGDGEDVSSNILIVETFRENDYLVCEFSDSGMGFSEEVKSKLFNPFFTTKEIGLGTGLGLAVAYDIIVNKHNGEISAQGSEWGGAKFVIKLPMHDKRWRELI